MAVLPPESRPESRFEFDVVFWTDTTRPDALRSAFRRKRSWVVGTQASRPLWYATVLRNLTGRQAIPKDVTIAEVRGVLSEGLSRSAFDRLKAITDLSGDELGRAISVSPRTLARRL